MTRCLTSQGQVFHVKYALSLLEILAVSLWIQASFAEKIIKPNITAPDFRASAEEKREELELIECDRRADQVKVPQNDRFAFIERCLQATNPTLK
jgi:hypothetical protein